MDSLNNSQTIAKQKGEHNVPLYCFVDCFVVLLSKQHRIEAASNAVLF